MFSLRNALIIARKDLKAYFASPIAYVIMSAFAFIMGYFFYTILGHYVKSASDAMRFAKPPSLSDGMVRPFFGNMNVILMFLTPFVTMRLFAEEKRNNTIELLITAPVRWSEIVLGKYLSALGFLMILLLLTVPNILTLSAATKPDWAVIFWCYAATVLMIGTYIAVGIWCSAVTENQIVAGILGFAFVLLGWVVGWMAGNVPPAWAESLTYMSIVSHFEDFSRGIFNTKDFFFYVSCITTWLFLTYKTLESYSWRS